MEKKKTFAERFEEAFVKSVHADEEETSALPVVFGPGEGLEEVPDDDGALGPNPNPLGAKKKS